MLPITFRILRIPTRDCSILCLVKTNLVKSIINHHQSEKLKRGSHLTTVHHLIYGGYWGNFPRILGEGYLHVYHCSHMKWGPKFVKMGTKWGPNFEWNWGPNGDLRQQKWGPIWSRRKFLKPVFVITNNQMVDIRYWLHWLLTRSYV